MEQANAQDGRRLPAGEYGYDDLEIGDFFLTSGMTVTESHVVSYAGLSGDLFDVHMDDDFARAQGFPGRIAHGLLGLALADGLKTRSPVRLLGIATLNWNWSFRAPLMMGDRIQVRVAVLGKRATRREDRGIVTLAMRIMNQHDTVVQDGETQLLMSRRPAAGGVAQPGLEAADVGGTEN
ncbi:acyl dehydratase [Aureimonas sp. Leaf454]|uniref:MaoC/PaaZ C-terminal domain-containing protein n=1 Tax=Aureimonas sp. Leaf454 TaxID=1736381 RepID=UPI000700316D|nr:MaoC/PaaZ C-terminal domain-containing protein [Aureimonas sp. Leaf454]KQT46178.1 acyl dehydratase [Aureimonas sp. Leaf454]